MNSKIDSCNNPIGLFDSGVGGFSVLKEIRKILPFENIVYFADTGRRRYGEKPDRKVLQYANEIIQFLISKNSKIVIIACNTATEVALKHVKAKYGIPITGVIEPGVEAAVKYSKNKRIGVIGSEITIRNKAHQKIIQSLLPTAQVFSLETPLLGDFVENNLSEKEKIWNTISKYLYYFKDKKIDTLILGCTHYPFLEYFIRKQLGDKVYLINPAKATAINLRDILRKNDLLNKTVNIPKYSFFTSGDIDKLNNNIKQLLKINSFTVNNYTI